MNDQHKILVEELCEKMVPFVHPDEIAYEVVDHAVASGYIDQDDLSAMEILYTEAESHARNYMAKRA